MFVVKRVSLLEITKKSGKWYFICLRQKEFRCMPGLLFKYQKENIALKEKYLYVFPICLSVCLYFYLPVSLSAWISVCPCFWVSIWLLIGDYLAVPIYTLDLRPHHVETSDSQLITEVPWLKTKHWYFSTTLWRQNMIQGRFNVEGRIYRLRTKSTH